MSPTVLGATADDQPLGQLPGGKLALTGCASFLGQLLLRRLAASSWVQEIHIFDTQPPDNISSSRFIFHRLDLRKDGADETLADTLVAHGIKTLVHGALFSGPGRNPSVNREVESIGTFHVLNACAEAKIEHLQVHSSTFVYGAHSQNPNFLTEKAPLKPLGPLFVRTRVDVEKQIEEFAKDYPSTRVTVLRFAPIMGPNSNNIRSRYFLATLVPKVFGYDPLLQFVHEDDAQRAALMALLHPTARGVYNIVGKGVIPLSTCIHLSGKIAIPAPNFLCRTFFAMGFNARAWDLPAQMLPFFQYLCVADGTRASEELGFQARYSSRQALKSMIEADRLRTVGFSVPSSVLGEEASPHQGFERII